MRTVPEWVDQAGPGASATAPPFPHGSESLDVIINVARLLFTNGQTTERTVVAVARFGEALGARATVLPRWGELTVRLEDAAGSHSDVVEAAPAGVEMHRVAETTKLIDAFSDKRLDIAAVRTGLAAIAQLPPVSLTRFASLAAAGAVALGVIFGVAHLVSLILIALSAGAGACLRRWLAGVTRNPFVQPFCAALLAGIVGALAVRLQLSTAQRLVAVCPCMILVPGPHVLNGVLDLARARIALGAARIGYAMLIVLMICTGLLLGLSLGGVTLPVVGASMAVPLGYDVAAAGVAVAAYGTFFAMPWRALPIPIMVGMLAHAAHWGIIAVLGGSAACAAFIACFVVGLIITPIADRWRMPFAAFAFASVVSLIPGVFLFRMAGGVVELVGLGVKASPELLLGVIGDGAMAGLIVLAMTFGLLLPKMVIEHFFHDVMRPRG
jgi:uncharacterized membrane protein YjjP (DUF1212 family)